MVALNNYLKGRYRFEHAAKRGASSRPRLDDVEVLPSENPNPCRTFDQAWARQLLARTRERMREECMGSGREVTWKTFERRVLAPCETGADPASYDQFVRDLGFQSPIQASNALVMARRMFDRILRLEIARYAPPKQIDDEIRDLFAAFQPAAQAPGIFRIDT